MKKIVCSILLALAAISSVNTCVSNTAYAISDSDIEKIMKAKEIVKTMVNYPDTLVFHNLYTQVSGNTVTLKFTAKNAFGVPETRTMNIRVN
jgi:ABC-type cobalt transport system substrate-binding protein